MKKFLVLILVLCPIMAFGQYVNPTPDYQFKGQVSVGTDTNAYVPSPTSSWLTVGPDSTNKGLILPRVVDTSDISNPMLGMHVFQIKDSTEYYWNGRWFFYQMGSDNRSPHYSVWGPLLVNTQGYPDLKDTAYFSLQIGDSSKAILLSGTDTVGIPHTAGALVWKKSDTAFYFGTGSEWRKISGQGSSASNSIDTVGSISALESYAQSASVIIVTDSLRGGIFRYNNTTLSADSGTIFPANGKNIGSWVRLWNKNTAMFEWFGAVGDGITNDAIALQTALDATFKNYSGSPWHTFLLDRPIEMFSGQTINGLFKLKRANQITAILEEDITSGTYTNPTFAVSDGLAFSVGQYVSLLDTVSNKWINGSRTYIISAVQNDSITLSGSIMIDSSFNAFSTIFYTTYPLIRLDSNDAVQNVTIDGNSVGNLYARWVSQSELETIGNLNYLHNVTIDNASGEGIICYGNNNKFDDIKIINSGGNGIHFSGAYNSVVDGATIINSNLDTLVGHVGGNITWSVNSGYTTISNSYLENGYHSFGNITDPGSGNLTLTNNTCVDAINGVLDMVQGSNLDNTVDNIVFSQNRVYNCGTTYISNSGNSNIGYNKVIINGNYFYNTPFYLWGVKNITISSCVFVDTINTVGGGGININSCQNVNISNNNINGSYYGVYLSNNDTSVNVIGNILKGQFFVGIFANVPNGKNINVVSNTITNYSSDSINYEGIVVGKESLVSNNSVNLSVGKYGIYCSGNNNTVQNNYSQGSVVYPIYLTGGSTGNVVRNNKVGSLRGVYDGARQNYVYDNYDFSGNIQGGFHQLAYQNERMTDPDTLNMITAGKMPSITFTNRHNYPTFGNHVIYLPDVTSVKNGTFIIKRQDTLTSYVDSIRGQGSSLIDSMLSFPMYAGSSIEVYSDGKNWWTLNTSNLKGINGILYNSQINTVSLDSNYVRSLLPNYWKDTSGNIYNINSGNVLIGDSINGFGRLQVSGQTTMMQRDTDQSTLSNALAAYYMSKNPQLSNAWGFNGLYGVTSLKLTIDPAPTNTYTYLSAILGKFNIDNGDTVRKVNTSASPAAAITGLIGSTNGNVSFSDFAWFRAGSSQLDPVLNHYYGHVDTAYGYYMSDPFLGQLGDSISRAYDLYMAGSTTLNYLAGHTGFGINTSTSAVDINGTSSDTGADLLRIRKSYTPTGTDDTAGQVGSWAWDDSYIYVKTSAGWKRAALTTF